MIWKVVLEASFRVRAQRGGRGQYGLVEDAVEIEGKLFGALSGLSCIEIVDGPLIVPALHRLEEAPDRPLRGASTQGVVVRGLVLLGGLHQRGKRRFFGRRGSRRKTQQRHQRPAQTDGIPSKCGHGF